MRTIWLICSLLCLGFYQASGQTIVYSQDFDEVPTFPENWILEATHPEYTWLIARQERVPFAETDSDSRYSALCPWIYSNIDQHERLTLTGLSLPEINQRLYLFFYAGYDPDYLSDANFTLELIYDANATPGKDTTELWDPTTYKHDTLSWTWNLFAIDLAEFAGQTVDLSWLYAGNNGDLVGIDKIWIEQNGLNPEAQILDFRVDNQIADIKPDVTNRIITIEVDRETDLLNDSLMTAITVSEGATVSPASGLYQNFKNNVPITYTVTPEHPDAPPQEWQVKVIKSTRSTNNDILSFQIPYQLGESLFDSTKNQITAEVDCDTDLDTLRPTISISPNANISPDPEEQEAFQNNVPFTYTVEAQDGSKKIWTVIVKTRDTEADIIGFELLEDVAFRDAYIDTAAHTVSITVNYGTDLTQLTPLIELPCSQASVSPGSGQTVIFNDGVPKDYTVTAADGNTRQLWQITVNMGPKNALFEDFDRKGFPPLNWTQESSQYDYTWIQSPQYRVPFSNIDPLDSSSAFCNWSEYQQDEWLITPVVSTLGFESLALSFYAGYHPLWLNEADLSVYIRGEGEDWSTPIWLLSQVNHMGNNWQWNAYAIDVDAYKDKNFVQVAFRYAGQNGDLIGIDNVLLAEKENSKKDVSHRPEVSEACGIYPNPCRGNLYINPLPDKDIRLFDSYGRCVLQHPACQQLDVSHLSAGLYILKTSSEGQAVSARIILLP